MSIEENVWLSKRRLFQIGYYTSLFGTFTILIWLGVFKFTMAEATAIKPLLEHHPLFAWMLPMVELQTISNLIGIIEISIALLLILSLKFQSLRAYAGLGIILTFVFTLSFLLFTPEVWRIRDGVLITDFFILKDIAYLGWGIMLLGLPRELHIKRSREYCTRRLL